MHESSHLCSFCHNDTIYSYPTACNFLPADPVFDLMMWNILCFERMKQFSFLWNMKIEKQAQFFSEIDEFSQNFSLLLMWTEWHEWTLMIVCSQVVWGMKPEWCPFVAMGCSWLELIVPVLQANSMHCLEHMLSLCWNLVCTDRFQWIWYMRRHCLSVPCILCVPLNPSAWIWSP